MMNFTFDMNLANILTLVVGSAIGFVWHYLNEKIKQEIERVKLQSESNFMKNDMRLSRLESDAGELPKRLTELIEGLKKLELALVTHYPTKAELDRALDMRASQLNSIEKLLHDTLEVLKKKGA